MPFLLPHIGHLHSLVIADIFARFERISGERPVQFITGTDEHGLKIQRAAQAKGMAPLAFCDELSESFRDLAKKADISSTMFLRTTERKHCNAVQHMWRTLDEKGLIYKGQHAGWYSVSDECFYTDLQVTEVDPGTGNDKYYVSSETGSRVEWQEENNYKFRLSYFRSILAQHYKAYEDAIYPPQYRAEILGVLSEPLEDLSISRPSSRLTWGVPVPGDPEHTIYVWIDALMVYLSSIGYPWTSSGDNGLSSGWPPDIQVIGKDILRFHAIYLPAMLAALDLPFSKRLLSHSHWTVDKHKMSKSVGNVADPIQAIDEYGVDIVRYYLARVGGRFKDDVDWSHEQLQKHSKEIMAAFGNLYSRNVGQKILSRLNGQIQPKIEDLHRHRITTALMSDLQELPNSVHEHMQRLEVADALDRIVTTLQKANLLVTQTSPWNDRATPVEVALSVHTVVLHALRVCGILLQPFIPSKASLVLDQLSIPENERNLNFANSRNVTLGELLPRVQIF
ncbi:Probable methionine--tRNA ligase [Sparassis crispa]|uniref:Probable methionine--tRNA ligase, mitochondrial n=1 Tax=Sparassis crispa TaxID=139825 RepID=A0A401GDH8_9APHY|nr:Probable methionine--tRNA ligase [Sparassis crispa]GBE80236.1 Probable methionine--tRNA ligase [Sparassis crispa]